MENDFVLCVLIICTLGWIPIFSLCKGIACIVDACHPNYIDVQDDKDDDKD